MSLIEDYPSSSPENSYYLPYNRRREYLSLVDKLPDPYLRFAIATKERYKPSDFFEKNIAVDIIDSGINPLKENFKKHLFEDEQKRVFKILDNLRENTISTLSKRPLSRDVYEKIKNIFIQTDREVHLENPSVSKRSPFSFTEDDFQVAGYDYQSYAEAQFIPDCHSFTMYKLNENHAFSYVFNPAARSTNPLVTFSQWGYEQVTTPTPGDLVVYNSTLKGYLEIKHTGIWTKNGKVLSKGGISDPIEHPIDDVVLGYGNFVEFYHKKIKSPLLTNFLENVDEALKSINNYNHSATRSPLTNEGCVHKMIQIFENLKISGVFKNSIYNVEYNLRKRGVQFANSG